MQQVNTDLQKLRRILRGIDGAVVPAARGYLLCFSFKGDHCKEVRSRIGEDSTICVHVFPGVPIDDATLLEDIREADIDEYQIDDPTMES